jgi:hypothetical protein
MWRRLLLACGIAASLLYVGADIVGAAVYPGYSYADQTISELQAIGSPSRPFVLPLAVLYATLVLASAVGVWLVAGDRRSLRVTAGLLGAYALACVPFAPMHTREVLAAGGATWSDTMHLVMTAVDALLLLAIVLVGSRPFGRTFRVYSYATLVVSFVCGMLAGRYGDAVAADLATPGVGILERFAVFPPMLWLVVFAGALLGLGVRRNPTRSCYPSASHPARAGSNRAQSAGRTRLPRFDPWNTRTRSSKSVSRSATPPSPGSRSPDSRRTCRCRRSACASTWASARCRRSRSITCS